jgi:hypothetical protein
MKYLSLFCLIIILLFSTLVNSAQLLPRYRVSNVHRLSSIEKLPVNQKRVFLPYLNRGRISADEGMQLFLQGKYTEFYQSTSKDFRNSYSQEQFIQLIEAFEKTAGKILFYEYRSQAIEVPLNTYLPAAFSKAVSNTTYAIRTTKVIGEFFMDIETTLENGKHKVSFLVTNNYGENVPLWLIKSITPKTQRKNQ